MLFRSPLAVTDEALVVTKGPTAGRGEQAVISSAEGRRRKLAENLVAAAVSGGRLWHVQRIQRGETPVIRSLKLPTAAELAAEPEPAP